MYPHLSIIEAFGLHWLCSDRQPLHDVEIIQIATGYDCKEDTLERAFNKTAWGLLYGTEYYNTSLSTVLGRFVFRSNGTTPDSILYRCIHTPRPLVCPLSNWKISVCGREVV